MSIYFYNTSIGKIGIEENSNYITAVYFNCNNKIKNVDIYEKPILKNAAHILIDYLNGKTKKFSLPIAPYGTNFMKEVWKVLCDIPYGQTRTYKQIAEIIGRPKAARAVGLACNKNPIPIFIPCHRVIGSNGNLTGYAGGIEIKKKLLILESSIENKINE